MAAAAHPTVRFEYPEYWRFFPDHPTGLLEPTDEVIVHAFRFQPGAGRAQGRDRFLTVNMGAFRIPQNDPLVQADPVRFAHGLYAVLEAAALPVQGAGVAVTAAAARTRALAKKQLFLVYPTARVVGEGDAQETVVTGDHISFVVNYSSNAENPNQAEDRKPLKMHVTAYELSTVFNIWRRTEVRNYLPTAFDLPVGGEAGGEAAVAAFQTTLLRAELHGAWARTLHAVLRRPYEAHEEVEAQEGGAPPRRRAERELQPPRQLALKPRRRAQLPRQPSRSSSHGGRYEAAAFAELWTRLPLRELRAIGVLDESGGSYTFTLDIRSRAPAPPDFVTCPAGIFRLSRAHARDPARVRAAIAAHLAPYRWEDLT